MIWRPPRRVTERVRNRLDHQGFAVLPRAVEREAAAVDVLRRAALATTPYSRRWLADGATSDAARRLVDRMVPGGHLVTARPLVARAWAPSRPVRSPHHPARDGRLRLLVAADDVDGHNGQLRVLRAGHPEPEPLSGADGSGVATIPMRRGDVVAVAPGTAIGAHPNHTDRPRVIVELEVAVGDRAELRTDDDPLESLADDGYRLVDALDPSRLRAVRQVLDDLDLPYDHAFYTSPKDANGALARRTDLAIREIVGDRTRELVPGYRPFMVAVTSKGAERGGPVAFHHDWTYLDEREARTVFLWCPLVDTSVDNGGMAVVPGSHRWTDAIRPSRIPDAVVVTEAAQAEYAERSVDVAVPAGAALMFDPALIHGSRPNPLETPRPAVTIALAPDDAGLVHFHEDPTGVLTGYEVDDAFFTTAPFRHRPEGYPPLRPWTRAVSEVDLWEALGQHGPRHRSAAPLAEAPSRIVGS